jgi:hypothetical protein
LLRSKRLTKRKTRRKRTDFAQKAAKVGTRVKLSRFFTNKIEARSKKLRAFIFLLRVAKKRQRMQFLWPLAETWILTQRVLTFVG